MIALAPDPETLAAHPPEEQRTIAELTRTVSASRLSIWQRCRLQFYFRYVAGIQKSPTPALHVGTTVHTALQQWNLARWHGRSLEAQELENIFSRAEGFSAPPESRRSMIGNRLCLISKS
jgi:PD-(D/E)XK nuclease superfamily protein